MSKYVSRVSVNITVAWLIVGIAMLFYLYDFFLQVSPSVMLPELMKSFDITAAQAGNVSAFYFYIYTIMQLPVGILYDRYSLRIILLGAASVCTLGAFLFGFSQDQYLASFSRFLMGLGASFAFVGVLKIATKHLPAKRLALVSGITTGLGMIGGIIGNVLLTSVIESIGWRWSMFSTGFAGVIIIILFWIFLRKPKKRLPYKWHASKRVQTKRLFLDLLSLIKVPSVWVNAIVAFLLFVPVTAFAALWSDTYLEQGQSFSPELAAVINSGLFLGVAIGGPVIGALSDFVKRRKIFLFISTLVTAVSLSFIVYLPSMPFFLALVLFFVTGLFIGSQTLCFPIARELSPPAIAATAFAFTNLIINLSGSLFQPIIGYLLEINWGYQKAVTGHGQTFSHEAFVIALSLVPISCLVGFFLTFFIKETHCELIYTAREKS